MNNLSNKRVLLGLTGGIAAYKCCELVRRLRDKGADVRIVMTQSACKFVTPLSFQALSANPVHRSLLDEQAEAAMGHIQLARWADVILIAPCSANFMAKLSQGLADDLLSTLVLASTAPLLIAPAMNQQMWQARATQDNLKVLESRGLKVLGPATGDQACGESGPGRMLEANELLKSLNDVFKSGLLAGQSIVVTAGPTREAIDPVRYITNRSSGKMGYAVARAAVEAGADVTLISGPTNLIPPERLSYIAIETADEMFQAVLTAISNTKIFISAAAVADYSVENTENQKIKKRHEELSLTLNRTVDILASVANTVNPPFTVGFAAETQKLETYAKNKLEDKKLDLIAANLVGKELGFDNEDNALHIFWEGGEMNLERASKDKLARQLIKIIATRYEEKNSNQTSRSTLRH